MGSFTTHANAVRGHMATFANAVRYTHANAISGQIYNAVRDHLQMRSVTRHANAVRDHMFQCGP